jgi:hypothetical protein
VVQGVHYVDPKKIILAPPSTEAAAAVFFPSRPLSHKENRPTPPRFNLRSFFLLLFPSPRKGLFGIRTCQKKKIKRGTHDLYTPAGST